MVLETLYMNDLTDNFVIQGNNSFFELFISNNYGVFGILPLSAYGYANISVIVTTPVSAYLDYENEFYRVQVYGVNVIY